MERGQRLVWAWTLIVALGIVSINGDIMGDLGKGSRLGHQQASPRVGINVEDPKTPRPNQPNSIIVQPGYEPSSKARNSQSNKPNKIIVQPGYEANSKVKSRQTNPSIPSGPANDYDPKSVIRQSNSPNSIIPSAQSAGVVNPQFYPPNKTGVQTGNSQSPKSGNPPNNVPVQPATEQHLKTVPSQPNPPLKIIVQPGYEQPDPRLGSPHRHSAGNSGGPPGFNIAVESDRHQHHHDHHDDHNHDHNHNHDHDHNHDHNHDHDHHHRNENPESNPVKKVVVQPQYGFYIAQPGGPSNIVGPTSSDQSFQPGNRPLNPYYMPIQQGWEQNPYIPNLQVNIPPRKIQPQYGQSAWFGSLQQPSGPSIVVQPGYGQSSNYGNEETEPPRNIVVKSGSGPGYWLGIPQLNPVYQETSRFHNPEYESTKNVAIQPGHGQSSGAGIFQLNSLVNKGVQPAHGQGPNFGNPETEPPKNLVVQPDYEPSSWTGVPQSNVPNNVAPQPGHQQNVPVQSASQQSPKARVPSGYPTINISFLRGYEPTLRAENSQSIPPEVSVEPGAIFPPSPADHVAYQSSYERPSPRERISQDTAPNNPPAQSIQTQNSQSNPPNNIVVASDYEQPSPPVGCSQSHAPINTQPPVGYDQIPIASNPVIQAARDIALQSGHGKPILKVIATQTTPPREVLLQPGYGQLHCQLKFIPQGNFAVSIPKDSTLEAEMQNNKELQQLVMNQLHSMQNQPFVPGEQEGRSPPYFAISSSHVFTPTGIKGYKKKKFKWGKVPLFLRSATEPQCKERNQYPRSLGDESGSSSRPVVWNYPEASSISQKNVSKLVDSIIPKIDPTVNSYVDSALKGIQLQQEQRNNTNVTTGITARIVDAAKTFEKKVSDVISPILGSQRNGEPPKNPNNSQNPQANYPNVLQNGYQGPWDLQQFANSQGFGGFPVMNGMANLVDEYGRNVMGVIPSSFNTAVGNSNAYLKGFYDNLKGHVH